jgi:hypothetical protein
LVAACRRAICSSASGRFPVCVSTGQIPAARRPAAAPGCDVVARAIQPYRRQRGQRRRHRCPICHAPRYRYDSFRIGSARLADIGHGKMRGNLQHHAYKTEAMPSCLASRASCGNTTLAPRLLGPGSLRDSVLKRSHVAATKCDLFDIATLFTQMAQIVLRRLT